MSLVRLRAIWITNHPPSVLWHCWLGHLTRKKHRLRNDLNCVEWDVKPCSTNVTVLNDELVLCVCVCVTFSVSTAVWQDIGKLIVHGPARTSTDQLIGLAVRGLAMKGLAMKGLAVMASAGLTNTGLLRTYVTFHSMHSLFRLLLCSHPVGRIAGFVRLSVAYGLLTWIQKGVREPKFAWTFTTPRVAVVRKPQPYLALSQLVT